ncbi:MAG: insulinase family protein, partial [Candidatus Sulfomarinibacteraceae bacterium]
HREVEDVIRAEVDAMRSAPPSSDELARALAQTRTDLAFNHESPAQIMGGLTEAVAMGDWRRFPRELEAISAVGADDVQRVAKRYLDQSNLTVGWFVPNGGGGASMGMPPAPRPCYLRRPFSDRVDVRELPGGARLAVLENPHAPTVTIAGTLAAGLSAAEDGRFTVPSLTAAMLDRGTTEHDRLALARELEDHGLHLGVRTMSNSPGTVSFSAQGLSDELDRLARLLVEVLRRPTFPADELDRLRRRVIGALQRERDDTSAQAHAALTRRLYPAGHPLHKRRVEDRQAELEGVTRDELEAFHRRAYGLGSLVLAVVGNVRAGEVVDALSRRLEGWRRGAEADVEVPSGSGAAAEDARIDLPDRPNLDFYLGHAGRLLRGDADLPAAILANSCLGQSALTSRLGLAVRDDAGLSYSVYSRFFGTLGIPGPWAVSCSVAAANLERAVELCREVIARYAAEGPTESELEDERQAQAGSYQVGMATNAGIARELVTTLTTGEPISRMDDYPERLLTTSRDEVVEAIRKHIRPSELTLAVAGTLPERSSD